MSSGVQACARITSTTYRIIHLPSGFVKSKFQGMGKWRVKFWWTIPARWCYGSAGTILRRSFGNTRGLGGLQRSIFSQAVFSIGMSLIKVSHTDDKSIAP